MMLKKENPNSKWRVALLKELSDREVSLNTQDVLTLPMENQPDYKKELVAKEILLMVVQKSKDETDMLKKLEEHLNRTI